jgi:uncharacterized protein (TIGR03067 family)
MKKSLLPALVVGLLAVASLTRAADEKADAEKELKKFEGTWVTVSAETNGKEAAKDELKGLTMTFQGPRFVLKMADTDRVIEGTFKVDPSKTPREYDATATVAGKKLTTVGIYEFDGDKLKVCYTPEGGKRPREFSSKGGTDEHPVFLTVYQRRKDK